MSQGWIQMGGMGGTCPPKTHGQWNGRVSRNRTGPKFELVKLLLQPKTKLLQLKIHVE